MTKGTVRLFALLSLASLLTGCEAVKSSNPLSPSVAGPIPGVVISEPKLLEPGAGWSLDNATQPVRLLIENSSTSGQRPLSYTFEVASDAQFKTVVFGRGGVAQGDGGRTSIQMTDRLPTGRAFFWRARAEDGANTGAYATAVSFSIVTPVIIDVPAPLSPTGGTTIGSTKPSFRIKNAAYSGPSGQIVNTIQVASDPAFASMVAVYNVPAQGSETRFDPPLELPFSRTFHWRVRAYDSGSSGVIGAWSGAQAFVTPAEPPPPPPPPPPSPSPSPSPGGSCNASSPLPIVKCERAKYSGLMSRSQTVAFLRAVARDLNRNGIAEGPSGILKKTTGNNCDGYSCDIVCNTRGEGWDVLSDWDNSQSPMWLGPKSVDANACQIQ